MRGTVLTIPALRLGRRATRRHHRGRVAGWTEVCAAPERRRRVMDLCVAGAGLVVTVPISGAAAATVRLGSRGSVLHRSVRVGRHGRPFVLYKFRTMVADAPTTGPGFTAGRDPRVTRVGRFLRATKIDELPQLVNVLRGDMSMVGPRPEDPRYVARYDEAQRQVLAARPGITSPATVAYRHEQVLLGRVEDCEAYYVDVLMPRKIEMDLAYLRRRTVRSDIKVILQTVAALVRRPTQLSTQIPQRTPPGWAEPSYPRREPVATRATGSGRGSRSPC